MFQETDSTTVSLGGVSSALLELPALQQAEQVLSNLLHLLDAE